MYSFWQTTSWSNSSMPSTSLEVLEGIILGDRHEIIILAIILFHNSYETIAIILKVVSIIL